MLVWADVSQRSMFWFLNDLQPQIRLQGCRDTNCSFLKKRKEKKDAEIQFVFSLLEFSHCLKIKLERTTAT